MSDVELVRSSSRARYYEREARRAVEVRRAYAKFRREVHSLGDPTPENVFYVLRRAGTAIAKLVGREAYSSMRVPDRAMLGALQRRVGAYLHAHVARAASDVALGLEGMRLFRDLSNFTELMMSVNLRASLVRHDVERIATALHDLATVSGATTIDVREDHPALLELEGRLPALDALLGHKGRTVSAARLAEVLEAAREATEARGGTGAVTEARRSA